MTENPEIIWSLIGNDGRSLSYALVPSEDVPVGRGILAIVTGGEADIEIGIMELDRFNLLIRHWDNPEEVEKFTLVPEYRDHISAYLDELDNY